MGVIYFLFLCSNFFLLRASSQILGNQSFTSIYHRFEIYRSVIRKLQTFLRCPSVQLTVSIPPLSQKNHEYDVRESLNPTCQDARYVYALGSKNIS